MDALGGAASMAAAALAAKRLTVTHGGESYTLLLVEGAETAALAGMLSARLCLGRSRFYLTLPDDDVMVPLTAALPDGLTLALHSVGGLRRVGEKSRGASPSPAMGSGFPTPAESPPASRAPGTPREASPSKAPNKSSIVFDDLSQMYALPSTADSAWDVVRGRLTRKTWSQLPAQLATSLLAEDPRPEDLGTKTQRKRSLSDASMDSMAVDHRLNSMAADVEETVERLDRFSRLSTDLANERTLLAWMRTSMAAFRSAAVFISLTGDFSYQAARVAMLAACVFSAISGIRRYTNIKKVTFMSQPPLWFGRLSIYWFVWLMLICNVAIGVGMSAPFWAKH